MKTACFTVLRGFYFLLVAFLALSSRHDVASSSSFEQQHDDDERYGDLSRAVLAAQQTSSSTSGVVLSTAKDSSQTRDQDYKKGKFHLDIQNLTEILMIDTDKQIATVQTKCTFSKLIKSTLQQYGLIPKVVPEFTSITVGGAMVGGGLESTSHQYGQVSDVVQQCTVLLGNGTLVNASSASHSDLFHALPGSYGTLGVVLELEMELMTAEPYVELTLHTYDSITDGVEALISLAEGSQDLPPPTFLEALQFPDGKFVIVMGEWKHELDANDKLIRPTTSRGLWFYEHIQDAVQQPQQQSSNEHQACTVSSTPLVLPTYDYLFRYERGAFWMARPMEFEWSYCWKNPFTCGLFLASWRRVRWLFSDLFSATRLYKMLHLAHPTVAAQRMLIMDSDIPASNASQIVDFVRDQVPITTPIWLLPVRGPSVPQPASNTGHAYPNQLLINVGIYGRVPDDNGIAYSRRLSEQVMQLGGRNMLYSQQDMTPEEFYQHQVDQTAYENVRDAYGATVIFPPLHEKVLRPVKEDTGGMRYWLTKLLL